MVEVGNPTRYESNFYRALGLFTGTREALRQPRRQGREGPRGGVGAQGLRYPRVCRPLGVRRSAAFSSGARGSGGPRSSPRQVAFSARLGCLAGGGREWAIRLK